MKLYLIRHGKTLANEKWYYCGSINLTLTQNGIDELKKLKYEIPDGCRYITSGMRRTEETLKLLFGDIPHTQDARFREMDFGIFEMHSYEELKERADYQLWISGDNDKNVPPEGESGEQMKIRVLDGLNELLEADQDTVLVTHGGVIAAIMEHLFPEENRNRYVWQPKPGHGYLIENGSYQELN